MLDLIIKNGQCYINGELKTVDLAINDGKILNIGKISNGAKNIIDAKDLLVLPGGVKALEKTRQNKQFIKFISDFHKAGKVIACICSGVQLLISAKVVKGKKIAGYYHLEDDITNAGAIYTDLPAVVDSKIITTAHYKDMGPWMRATLDFFNEKKK